MSVRLPLMITPRRTGVPPAPEQDTYVNPCWTPIGANERRRRAAPLPHWPIGRPERITSKDQAIPRGREHRQQRLAPERPFRHELRPVRWPPAPKKCEWCPKTRDRKDRDGEMRRSGLVCRGGRRGRYRGPGGRVSGGLPRYVSPPNRRLQADTEFVNHTFLPGRSCPSRPRRGPPLRTSRRRLAARPL